MKQAVLLLWGTLLTLPTMAQQHAPTIEQCRADATVWGDRNAIIQYEDKEAEHLLGVENDTVMNATAWKEGLARANEMAMCLKVDPPRHDTYTRVMAFYHEMLTNRVSNFMDRHKLWDQFFKEDRDGAR